MKLQRITITNFKSVYGTTTFDFESVYTGMTKLSGPVGSGKTSMGEAILWGLYGKLKDHKNPNLVSWGTAHATIELYLVSKGRNIHIVRDTREPLVVHVDGKVLGGSSKLDVQGELEGYYDVPKIAVERMCVISFSAFASIASMNPSDTKNFLDNIFGFKLLSTYSDETNAHRKARVRERDDINAVLEDTKSQIQYLCSKRDRQKSELSNNVDVESLRNQKDALLKRIEKGNAILMEHKNTVTETLSVYDTQLSELSVLGKKEREYYTKFESGVCPTCGHEIDQQSIIECKERLETLTYQYKTLKGTRDVYASEANTTTSKYTSSISELQSQVRNIDTTISSYETSLRTLNENYNSLISDAHNKINNLEAQLSTLDTDIGEWNDMVEFFTRTARYKILDTMIPHINRSVQSYIDKFDQPYTISFDQEFRCHVYSRALRNEISYTDLSTGQRKSLDLTIIFGILENLISNIDFNVFFFDELFTNMDTELRNVILGTIKNSLGKDKSIFIINHSEMADDYFDHKVRVRLYNDKIVVPKKKGYDGGTTVIKKSRYERIF